MAKILLLQFDSDPDCAVRRDLLSGLGATLVVDTGQQQMPTGGAAGVLGLAAQLGVFSQKNDAHTTVA